MEQVLVVRAIVCPCDAVLPRKTHSNVSYLLPDAALAGADGADALQQLAKVILAKGRASLFEALVIQGKALEHILLEDAGGPDAKVGRPAGIDAIAYGNDGIEIVEIKGSFDLSLALLLNYFHFGKSCLGVQLSFRENIGEMLGNCRNFNPEQLRHGLLGQPDGFVADDGVDGNVMLGGSVYQKRKGVAHEGS